MSVVESADAGAREVTSRLIASVFAAAEALKRASCAVRRGCGSETSVLRGGWTYIRYILKQTRREADAHWVYAPQGRAYCEDAVGGLVD
jgi:hypothetical protein